jgi:hypothetical protein
LVGLGLFLLGPNIYFTTWAGADNSLYACVLLQISASIDSQKKKIQTEELKTQIQIFYDFIQTQTALLLQIDHFLRFHSVPKLNLALTNPTKMIQLFLLQIKEKQSNDTTIKCSSHHVGLLLQIHHFIQLVIYFLQFPLHFIIPDLLNAFAQTLHCPQIGSQTSSPSNGTGRHKHALLFKPRNLYINPLEMAQ